MESLKPTKEERKYTLEALKWIDYDRLRKTIYFPRKHTGKVWSES